MRGVMRPGFFLVLCVSIASFSPVPSASGQDPGTRQKSQTYKVEVRPGVFYPIPYCSANCIERRDPYPNGVYSVGCKITVDCPLLYKCPVTNNPNLTYENAVGSYEVNPDCHFDVEALDKIQLDIPAID